MELILKRSSTTSDSTAIAIVSGSISETRARPTVTPTTSASETTFTPSSSAPNHGDWRRRGTNGRTMATRMNAGRKMPIVAMMAPGTPPRMKPTNVAEVNNGPGVICPTTMASSNC